MICFRDTTFCGSNVKKHTCGREFTDADQKAADKSGMPVVFSNFCREPEMTKLQNMYAQGRSELVIPSECPECLKKDDIIGRLQDLLTLEQDETEKLRSENIFLERALRHG